MDCSSNYIASSTICEKSHSSGSHTNINMATGGKRRSFNADLDHMRNLFDSVDSSKTGYIGFKELCLLVCSIPGIEEETVPELMENLDRDKDGKVTFEDFEVLFAQEREEIEKKQKLNSNAETLSQILSDSNTSHDHHYSESESEHEPDQSLKHSTALDQISSISLSPQSTSPKSSSFLHRGENAILPGPTVTLRRAMLFDETQFSPIHAATQKRHLSNELPDLASQMRYLTDISSSPQLRRGSKILSWISESGELFDLEGKGQLCASHGIMSEDNELLSPPLSPMRGSDEGSNFKAILESVCDTDKIDKEAISRLCKHVKADPQEESELLALLSNLDKRKVGYVSLDEFVHNLQLVHNAAIVDSTPIDNKGFLKRAHCEVIPPPNFDTRTTSSTQPPFPASTPLPSGATYTIDTSVLLTVLDPDNSGVVKVENLVNQWQQMGVEAPLDANLEDALSEVVSIDPAGRVNVSELATSLEGALLPEENKTNVLRQVALKLYKTEISTLRIKVHHISLERDTLRNSLNRTLEENKRLIKEGDEHADLVQQQSEQRLKQTEAQLADLLYKEKRLREEEARQMQERAASLIEEMEKKVEALRGEEKLLRQNLKLQQDECFFITNELQKANNALDEKDRTIQSLQRDLGYRFELDIGVDETHLSRLRELESEVVERAELVANLREGITEMQDKYDLLVAENEKLKQKYLSQKRLNMRKRSSTEGASTVEKRHSISDRSARPRSGSLSGHTRRREPCQPSISFKLDLATEGSHHSILWEEEKVQEQENTDSSEEMEEADLEPLGRQYKKAREEAIIKSLSEDSATDEDDFFARSSTSLMQEIQIEEEKNVLENKIEQHGEGKAESLHSHEELEQQMKMDVVDSQVADMIPKHFPNEQGYGNNISILVSELNHSKSLLEEERNSHSEAVTFLQQQLNAMEENNDLQTQQYLRLEEEKARAERELTTLQHELDYKVQLSESRVNALVLKLENLKKSHTELEAEMEKQLRELQGELSNAYKAVKEFKEKSIILEDQLKDAQDILQKSIDNQTGVLSKEVVKVPASHADHVTEHDASLKKLQAEYTCVSQLNDQLQKENIRMCATEERTHGEILHLQKQLSAMEKELNDQSEVYTNEISRLKEDIEREKEKSKKIISIQLKEMHSSLMKEMDDSTQKYKLTLETLQEELTASKHREKALQEKLVESGVQYERSVSKVANLVLSEPKCQECVIDLEHTQSQYLSEVSQLKADIQKYLTDLSNMKAKEMQYNEIILNLQKELEQGTNFKEEAESGVATAYQSPNFSTYKSDSELKGKLIVQMKSQLEELQRLLLRRTQSDGSEVQNALSLIQELLTHNSALDSAAKQMERGFESKHQAVSENLVKQDSELKYLQSEVDRERKALKALVVSNLDQLVERMYSFHDYSNKTLDKYIARIEAAAIMLGSIRTLIREQEPRHINTLGPARTQFDKLQSEEPISNNFKLSKEASPFPVGSKRRVDEGSGQLIDSSSEADDTQCQQSLVQQKDKMLHDEIQEKHTRTMFDELEQNLTERKQEVLCKATELQEKESLVKELKTLNAMEGEPTEAMRQGVDKLPLDNLKGESLGVKDERMEVVEAAKELLVLRKVLETTEAKLVESRQTEKRLKLFYETKFEELITKHAAEVSTLHDEMQSNIQEVQMLYLSLIDKDASSQDTPADGLAYSQLVLKASDVVESLKQQLKQEQDKSSSYESTLLNKIEEHDQLDAQFQAEHEEEVRALRQQKQQLARQIEDLKLQYQQSISEQDTQNSIVLQELMNKKAGIEKELEEKTEEAYHVYQQVADLMEEKKVLMDIVHQLCAEAGRQMDVV